MRMTSTAVETLAAATAELVEINASIPTESRLFDLKQQLCIMQQTHARLVKHMETEVAGYNWGMTKYEVSPRDTKRTCPMHPMHGLIYKTHAFLVPMLASHCVAVKALIPEFTRKIHGHACIDVVKREEVDCKVGHKRKRLSSEATRLSLVASWDETDSYATKDAQLNTLKLQLEEADKMQQELAKLIEKRAEKHRASPGPAGLSDRLQSADATIHRVYAKWFLRHACKIEDKIASIHTSAP
ncbi:hypothetical protein T484DRAFT_1755671 [Baffinella frigidus]|nr:hypothetical protein T484DRAFT_1755671 [Cryptophyta sp. CCMP2293]